MSTVYKMLGAQNIQRDMLPFTISALLHFSKAIRTLHIGIYIRYNSYKNLIFHLACAVLVQVYVPLLLRLFEILKLV